MFVKGDAFGLNTEGVHYESIMFAGSKLNHVRDLIDEIKDENGSRGTSCGARLGRVHVLNRSMLWCEKRGEQCAS